MASAANPLLMTVEEYRQLPDKPDVIQELHWGHVVTLSRPQAATHQAPVPHHQAASSDCRASRLCRIRASVSRLAGLRPARRRRGLCDARAMGRGQ